MEGDIGPSILEAEVKAVNGISQQEVWDKLLPVAPFTPETKI